MGNLIGHNDIVLSPSGFNVGELYILDYDCSPYINYDERIHGLISDKCYYFCLQPVMYIQGVEYVFVEKCSTQAVPVCKSSYWTYQFIIFGKLFEVCFECMNFCMFYKYSEKLLTKLRREKGCNNHEH